MACDDVCIRVEDAGNLFDLRPKCSDLSLRARRGAVVRHNSR